MSKRIAYGEGERHVSINDDYSIYIMQILSATARSETRR